uniref:non-specific serine/threonine protein kinase n=1 Tax=Hyaloperonospora arabidopsidis (strain Emoy2) TaxID=559515 RepID=M4B7S9_HYAAE
MTRSSPRRSRSARRSSHRRSSTKRSSSRSRDRSRRSSHRHHSRSTDRHKRRRRDRDGRRSRRRSRSRSDSDSRKRRSKPHRNEPVVAVTSTLSQEIEPETAATSVQKSAIGSERVHKQLDLTNELKVVEQGQETVQESLVENERATSDTDRLVRLSETKETEVEEKCPVSVAKPAVNVHLIKENVLKALADARSTIAGIKKGGVQDSCVVTTMDIPVRASVVKEDRQEPKTVISKNQAMKMLEPIETTSLSLHRLSGTAEDTSADEFDMFSMAALDDQDDAMNGSNGVAAVSVEEVSLQSNCDDADGYYSTTIGEVLDGKYRVLGAVGKGVFSTVLRCQCITPLQAANCEALSVVAIKIIRNNDVMRDAAQTELKLLKQLGKRDPRDKKHCIRLLDSFSHRNHVAMVFEPMQMNVREAMKKFGGKGGISIQAVRVFSKHLLIALNHLESCGVIHADIKPDNILLNEKQTTVKLCDFGSAFRSDEGKQDPTPYLVSRFYRAPEIVLGLAYNKAVDMWSIGCCLYEMFTGKVVFPGSTNNEMLKLFMELKGKISNKLIKKHRQAYVDQLLMEPHFTEDLKFCSRESDQVTGKPILRLMGTFKTKVDLASSLLAAKSASDDRKLVLELRDLLDRMFTLDPSRRISVKDALVHPFVKG